MGANSKGSTKRDFALHAVYTGGHNSSINSVALASAGAGRATLVSGDWDGGLCLWHVPEAGECDGDADVDAEVQMRKRHKGSKHGSAGAAVAVDVKEVSPTSFFRA